MFLTRTLVGLVATVLAAAAQAKELVTVIDLAGRSVTVAVPVDAIILGEGRYLPNLAILDRADPTARIAAMMGDFKQLDPATYRQYAARFPRLDAIPVVGRSDTSTFSLEKAIDVRADLAVFGLSGGHGPGPADVEILDLLKGAGIPAVIVDFRIDPLVNTPKSLALLGKLMGREAEAVEFRAFYHDELDRVVSRLSGVTEKPRVFMESRVGLGEDCCEAIGDIMMGRFIATAGGENVFAARFPGTHGTVALEHLIVDQPDIYVGTAIGSQLSAGAAGRRIVLGPDVPADAARASLVRATQRIGIASLAAVQAKNAHAIWHHFYNSPMNVVAVQAMAKWFHPARFRDLDPQATLEAYFRRFQPVPPRGVYWTSLNPE